MDETTIFIAAILISEAIVGFFFNSLVFIILLSPKTKIYNLIKALLSLQVLCSLIHVVLSILKLPQFLGIGYPETLNHMAAFVLSTGPGPSNAFCHLLAVSAFGVSGASTTFICLSALSRLAIVALGPSRSKKECSKKKTFCVLGLGMVLAAVQLFLVKQAPPQDLIRYNACSDPSSFDLPRYANIFTGIHYAPYKIIMSALNVTGIVATILTAITIRLRKPKRSNSNHSRNVEGVGMTYISVVASYIIFEACVASLKAMNNFILAFAVSQFVVLLHGLLIPLVFVLASSHLRQGVMTHLAVLVHIFSRCGDKPVQGEVANPPILPYIVSQSSGSTAEMKGNETNKRLENKTSSTAASTEKPSGANVISLELEQMELREPSVVLGPQLVDVVAHTLQMLHQERVSREGTKNSGSVWNPKQTTIHKLIEKPECNPKVSRVLMSDHNWEYDTTKSKSYNKECKQEQNHSIEYLREDEQCSNPATVGSARECIECTSAQEDEYKNKIFFVRKSAPKDHYTQQATDKLVIVNLDGVDMQ